MEIHVSTGQSHYEGASVDEHRERQRIYETELRVRVEAAYPSATVTLEARWDDGRTHVTCDHETECSGAADRIRDHVHELVGAAWMASCEAEVSR